MKARYLFIAICVGGILSGCAGTLPSNLGSRNGKLTPCPDKPNCVSSQSSDPGHAIAPLTYSSTDVDAFRDLKIIVGRMKQTAIIKESDGYLHVTFKSRFFGFVDDVEFVLDRNEKVIHVRSASRMGYSDMGVNRKRLGKIREAWERL